MTATFPALTLGIEEEYLLVDRDSLSLAEAPAALMEACQNDLQSQVSPEFLQCQIEVGTRVCQTIADARDDLRRLRSTVSRRAAEHNLSPIAVSCHPFADWKQQHHTQKQRYNDLERDLGGVVRRMLICGMHVHVGVEDKALRTDLMPQLCYFLPHLLALSTSSPYWQGDDTGLASYRLTVFDNLPRTGLPPRFDSWAEYERTAGTLIAGRDRGHHQDLVGSAPVAPVSDAGNPDFRCLAPAGTRAVAGGAETGRRADAVPVAPAEPALASV